MTTTVIIPEVQIDFANVHDAQVMENYAKTELKLEAIVTDNPPMLSVYDVPEAKLNSIRRRCAIENYSRGTVRIINATRDAIVGAADFAAYRVVTPVAQAGIKATTGIAKVVAKTALATSATLVGSALENARRTSQELKTDPEVIHAKAELSGAYNAIKNMFGFTSSSNGVRVINE
jgi:hypothetical protein